MAQHSNEELLQEMLSIASDQAYAQNQDLYDDTIRDSTPPECKVYGFLDFTDAHRGQENEYKFYDKASYQRFLDTNGHPTAARALLFGLYNKPHDFKEEKPVYMLWNGKISNALGTSSGLHKIPLHTILKPYDFMKNYNVDAEITFDAAFCRSFWDISLHIIRDSPHLLKATYKVQRGRRTLTRWSWARFLVLLFLPVEEIQNEVNTTNVMPIEKFDDWYNEAIDETKDAILSEVKDKSLRLVMEKKFETIYFTLHKVRIPYIA